MEKVETFLALSAFSGESGKASGESSCLPFVAWHSLGQPVSKQEMLEGVESKVRQQRFLRDARHAGDDGWGYMESLERQLLSLLGEMDARDQKLAAREKAVEELSRELEIKSQQLVTAETALQETQAQMTALQSLTDVIGKVTAEIDSLKKGYWCENLPEIVEFALDLTEKIVGDRLIRDPQILLGHIRGILEGIKVGESIDVHLSPVDYAALTELKSEPLQAILQRPEIRFVTDMRLSSGDVLMDTDKYRLDASLRTAIRNIRADVLESLIKSPVAEAQPETPEEDPAT